MLKKLINLLKGLVFPKELPVSDCVRMPNNDAAVEIKTPTEDDILLLLPQYVDDSLIEDSWTKHLHTSEDYKSFHEIVDQMDFIGNAPVKTTMCNVYLRPENEKEGEVCTHFVNGLTVLVRRYNDTKLHDHVRCRDLRLGALSPLAESHMQDIVNDFCKKITATLGEGYVHPRSTKWDYLNDDKHIIMRRQRTMTYAGLIYFETITFKALKDEYK